MTVQPSQGHEPGDTPSEELDRLIGAAAEAAGVRGPGSGDRRQARDLGPRLAAHPARGHRTNHRSANP